MATSVTTKYLAPTNTKSARIVVKGFGRRKVYSWDYTQDVEHNHRYAAYQFIKALNDELCVNYAIQAFASMNIATVDYVAIVA